MRYRAVPAPTFAVALLAALLLGSFLVGAAGVAAALPRGPPPGVAPARPAASEPAFGPTGGPVGGFANVPVLFAPDGEAYDPVNGEVYVADGGSGYVSVFSATTDATVATVPVGFGPEYVTADPVNGDVYVANLGSSNISVLDGATNRLVASIAVPPGQGPMAVDPVTGDVFVPAYDGAVSVIDGANNSIVATVPVGVSYSITQFTPPLPVYDPVSGDIYQVGFEGYNTTCGCAQGQVVAINGTSLAVVATIPVGENPASLVAAAPAGDLYVANGFSRSLSVISPATQTVTATLSGYYTPNWLAYDPDTRDVYVGEVGTLLDVVSTVSQTKVATLTIAPFTGPMAIDPSFGHLDIVAGGNLFTSATVTVVSLATNSIAATVAVGFPGLGPTTLAFDPTNGNLFVTNSGSSNVSVLGPYPITFTPSGLRVGTPWTVTLVDGPLNNWTLSSHDRAITFFVDNGTYTYSASVPELYAAGNADGTLAIDGAPGAVTVGYHWSDEVWAGLIAGTAFVPIGGWLAIRGRGAGLSPLRREYHALFQEEMHRGRHGQPPHRPPPRS